MTQLHMNCPITKESNLHQSPNHSGITNYITFPKGLDHTSPYMTKFDNVYIIGIYMNFTSNDIYDMYNKDNIPL